jgi:hypothetical protein
MKNEQTNKTYLPIISVRCYPQRVHIRRGARIRLDQNTVHRAKAVLPRVGGRK